MPPLHALRHAVGTLTAAALLTCFAASVSPTWAQSPAQPQPSGEHFALRASALGNEERDILVYMPMGYASQPERHYDVLYVLDGSGIGPLAAGVGHYLALGGRIPPLIVVGVVSKSSPDRFRNFTPVVDPAQSSRFPTAGGADAFLRFMGDELIPAIEKRYRVTGRRYLVGHSLGGLFALHTLASRPTLFRGYLALSPSTAWADGAVLRELVTRFADPPTDSIFLFVTAAAGEDMPATEEVLRTRTPAVIRWRFARYQQDDHFTTVPPALHDGLRALFANSGSGAGR